MARYKTITVGDIRAPRHAQVADIRVSVNLYGDRWNSGTGRFDDFSVKVTTISSLVEIAVSTVAMVAIVFATVLVLRSRRRQRT